MICSGLYIASEMWSSKSRILMN